MRRVLPARPGARLAPGFGGAGSVRIAGAPRVAKKGTVSRGRLRITATCAGAYSCPGSTSLIGAPVKGRKGRGIIDPVPHHRNDIAACDHCADHAFLVLWPRLCDDLVDADHLRDSAG